MEPLGRSSYGFMKNLTTTLIFFLFFIPLSLASGPRASGLHLQDRIESCSVDYGITPSTLLSRKTEELFNQENSLSWETVKAETLNQAQDQTLIELIENNNYKLAHKLSLIYLEKGEVLAIRPETDTHHFQVILKLLKSSNLEAQKLSFFLMGYFSPNPFLSRGMNFKLAKFYACIGKEKLYPNVIFPFFIVFRATNTKSGCTEYAKSPELFDPCGNGGSSYGQGSEYMGSVEIPSHGRYDVYASYENFNDWDPSNPVVTNDFGGRLGLPSIGAGSPQRGEPGGAPTQGNGDNSPADSSENSISVAKPDTKTKSEFERSLEGILGNLTDESFKEIVKEALEQVDHTNADKDEKKRNAQKEAILNSFHIVLPSKTSPLEGRIFRQLQQRQYPARGAAEDLFSERISTYTFASEDQEFLDRAQNLYQKVTNIKTSSKFGEHPLSASNIKNTAKYMSLATIEAADQANYLGGPEVANVGLEIAETLADVALGVTPGISIINDAYSLFYGKHVLFGTELSVTERVFAGVGILTLGGSNWIKHGGKILGKALIRFGQGAGSIEKLSEVGQVLKRFLGSARKLGIDDEAKFKGVFNSFKKYLQNEAGHLNTDSIINIINGSAKAGWKMTTKVADDLGRSIKEIRIYKKLPNNFITKKQANNLGWDPRKGNLHEVAPGKSIGGDIWRNRRRQLPEGKTYYEADLGYKKGYRGKERLIWSDDGEFYITNDHYESFTEIVE